MPHRVLAAGVDDDVDFVCLFVCLFVCVGKWFE
jgi:hypothetical protein